MIYSIQFVDTEVLTVDFLSASSCDSLVARFKKWYLFNLNYGKKIAKKYAKLIIEANNITVRKQALSLIQQATKLKNKLDQYKMM